jgi:hypothetical protein
MLPWHNLVGQGAFTRVSSFTGVSAIRGSFFTARPCSLEPYATRSFLDMTRLGQSRVPQQLGTRWSIWRPTRSLKEGFGIARRPCKPARARLVSSCPPTRRPKKKRLRRQQHRHIDTFSQNQGKHRLFIIFIQFVLFWLFIINTCKDKKLSCARSPHALTCLSCIYKLHRRYDSAKTSRRSQVISVALSSA